MSGREPPEQLNDFLKILLGYRPAANCCQHCTHFVPTDCSGNANATSQHCTFNPSVQLPVEEHGSCLQFKADPVKMEPYLAEQDRRNTVAF